MEMPEVKEKKKPDQGFNIKVRRMRLHWGQDLVADMLNEKFKLNYDQSNISKIENEPALPEKTLEQFAEVLQCDVEYLRDFTVDDYFNAYSYQKNDNFFNGESVTDNDVDVVTTQNNYSYTESPKFYEFVEQRIKDAELIGSLKEQIKALTK